MAVERRCRLVEHQDRRPLENCARDRDALLLATRQFQAALASFDQDQWARLGDYRSWSPAEGLEMFRLLRDANLRMLRNLSGDEWGRFGVHAERGRISVRDLAQHMAGHDMNHVDQIRTILGRRS
jgi:hypothetical protein